MFTCLSLSIIRSVKESWRGLHSSLFLLHTSWFHFVKCQLNAECCLSSHNTDKTVCKPELTTVPLSQLKQHGSFHTAWTRGLINIHEACLNARLTLSHPARFVMQLLCLVPRGEAFPLIWGGFGWIMDNKSPRHPGMAAPRRRCINEVLCHHLKPRGPLAEKTQNQLSSTVSSLNFPPSLPPPHTHTHTSSRFQY